MKLSLLIVAAAAVVAVGVAANGSGAGFNWESEAGAFTVTTVSLTTKSGNPFGPGEVCTLHFEGNATGPVLAGTVKYKLYEDGVQHFIDQGNYPYFQCTNKGCDPTAPVALTLNNPNDKVTPYKVSVDYTMHMGSVTKDFRLVVWGMDQNKFPYDFSITIGYNFTAAAEAAAAAAAPRALSTNVDPFSEHSSDGTFKVSSVTLATPSGHWAPGASATATVAGVVDNKVIKAGTIKYKVYEYGMQHFIAQGFSDYFQCDNKGCDPTQPIALTLKDPSSPTSEFTAALKFVMPAKQATGIFTVSFFGTDQDHIPYDFTAEVGYNFTSTDAAAAPRALAVTDGPAYTSDWDSGAFKIESVVMSAPDGAADWAAGGAAQVVTKGHVVNKDIVAGTLRYKLYEYEVQYFVQQDNTPYFTCDNKGCDRSHPIALALEDPTDLNSAFTATMNFTLPKAKKSGVFSLTLWGVDQDQAPYDFSANVHFNYTSTL